MQPRASAFIALQHSRGLSMKFSNYEKLVHRIDALPGARIIIAVAGPPGSGKSTLAEKLVQSLNVTKSGSAAIIPMDGFHYDDSVLQLAGLLNRKGAPETFDTGGFASLLKRLRDNVETAIAVPVFDRKLELSRAAARVVGSDVRILVVEGNYLLLDDAAWSPLRKYYDFTVMVNEDLPTLKARLINRWLGFGYNHEQAAAKAEGNDLPNAELVLARSLTADITITSA
jgi:pantothenate kinase